MSVFRLFCFKTHILYLRFQELKSSRANQDITIRIDFKKIPVQRIEPQSSSRVINKMKIFPFKKKITFIIWFYLKAKDGSYSTSRIS